MGKTPGWWHCKQEEKTKTHQNSQIPETGRQLKDMRTHISPDPFHWAFTAKPLFSVTPFTHLLQVWKPRGSLWAGKSHLAGGIWGGIQPLLPQAGLPGCRSIQPRLGEGRSRSISRHQQDKHSSHLHCCGTEKSLCGSRPGLGTRLIWE